MLNKVQDQNGSMPPDIPVDGFFDVTDELLDSKGIHTGARLSYSRDVGKLVAGRVYIVREHEEAEPVARVYARDSVGERFSTACSAPSWFWRTSETKIDAVAVAITRPMWP